MAAWRPPSSSQPRTASGGRHRHPPSPRCSTTSPPAGLWGGTISTVVYRVGERRIASTHTTPDVIRLNALMSRNGRRGLRLLLHGGVVARHSAGAHPRPAFRGFHQHHPRPSRLPPFAYIEAKKLLSARRGFRPNERRRPQRPRHGAEYPCTGGRLLRVTTSSPGRVLEQQHLDGMLLRLGGDEVWVGFLGRTPRTCWPSTAPRCCWAPTATEVLTAMSCLA